MVSADALKGIAMDICQADTSMQRVSLFLCSLHCTLKLSQLHQLGQGGSTL